MNPVGRVWNNRGRAAAVTLWCIFAVMPFGAKAQSPEKITAIRFGYSPKVFVDVNTNDATAALKFWGETIAGRRDIPGSLESRLYDDFHSIKQALDNLGEIDRGKITAQQTRRILDRLVGYRVSPLLWKKIGKGLSAGRVQSIALRLICEREKQIKDFH